MTLKNLKSIFLFLFIYQSVTGKAQNCTVSIVTTSSFVCLGYTATLTAFGASSYTWTAPLTTLTPVYSQSIAVGPGNYVVQGSSGSCTSSASITIYNTVPLLINLTATSLTTCISSNQPLLSKPVVLTASGANTYTWSSNVPQVNIPATSSAAVVAPPSSACYTVVGNTSVCSGSVSFCLTVKPQFTISVIPGQSSICNGSTLSLGVGNVGSLATGPSSLFTYNWSESPGLSLLTNNTATVSALPQVNTIYSLQVNDALGCASTLQTATVSIIPCQTGFQNTSKTNERFYFNSIENTVCIESDNEHEFQIFNLSGETVYEKKRLESGKHLLNIGTLPEGIYFLKINSNQNQKTLKIFKTNY